MNRIVVFLLLCFWCEEVSLKNLGIRYLTNNDGLSNSSVNCIFQDSSDLLWFGTWDGLNMYNGRGFTVFKPDPSLQNTISNNIIRNIIEGLPGVLWIATDNGINRYQKSKRQFDNYFFSQTPQTVFKENSFHVAKNSKNQIFATYEAALYYFNENEFIPIDIKNMGETRSLFFDVDDNLWIYTGSKELHQIKLSSVNGSFLQEGISHVVATNVNAVFYNPFQNKIYIQKENRKIVVVDPKNNSIANCGFEIKDVIYSMLFDDKYCYIGTANKLIEVDLHTNQETTLLSNHSVLSIYKDKQNILWVGTDARGLVMLTEPKEIFFSFTSKNVQDFGSAPVRSFFDDDKGRLWIGTKGDGLYVVNEDEQKATIANKFNIPNGLLSNSIYVLSGNNKIVWIGTEGNGLNYFDFKLNKLGKLQLADSMNLTSVYAIHIQNDSTLWVGTSGYGLYRLTIHKFLNNYRVTSYKQFVYQRNNPNSLSNNVIYSILPDGENELWIGTRGGGLNKLNYITETFTNYKFSVDDKNSISSDDVLSLFKDRQNNLWIGTSMGLNQMITGEDKKVIFNRYTEKDGISNNTIHGILEDKQGDIWFSTNKGLSRFNVAQNKIVTYFQNNGLQNDEFSDGAYYASVSNQYFYFGGISGYNKFDPLKILKNTYMPPLYLDNFSINNVTVNLDDYSKQIKGQEHITLGYKDKIFSFTFIPLDYIDGAKCDLEYQLKDHTNEWIKLRSSRTIVFSNVPAGNYTFNVRWSNAEKEWNQQIYTRYITILPPWWLSRYAFLTYVIIIFAMAYFVYRLFKNRMIMKHKLELQTLENQKSEEIHQAKLRFFTNIAHEFCNSLTLIYGPCEQLMQHENKPVAYRKYLNTIKTNAERMQGLIQQLMEFRRVETGYLEIDIEKVDIPELIKYTSDYFVEIAEQKRITFNVNIAPNVTYWTTDMDFLEKIIFNLLSNAFKYTPEGGSATLDTTVENDHLKITITNTGSGIKLEDQQSIFDRFTILDRFESQILQGLETRTGIGLAVCKDLIDLLHGIISVKSQPKEYASFEVLLPVLDVSHQHEKQHKEQPLSYNDIVEHLPIEKVKDNEQDVSTLSQKQTVLVIDDESDICDLLSDILQNQYHVLKAESGEKAFEILEEQLPDIIICDIIMPGMNGIDVVRKLKSQEVTAHIPIIFLTSELSVESQIISIETGVDTYVTKPFHARFLLATIHQLLNRKQQLKEYYDSPVSSVEKMDGKLIPKTDKEFILKLTKMVSDNIENESLSLDILTKEMGISKIQLYRKLKEIKNQTPTEFIRNIRLNHAEKLLRTTDKTVQEIMYACGFNNKAYFYREFAKQYRQTPKEYRIASNKK